MSATDRYIERRVEEEFGRVKNLVKKLSLLEQENRSLKKDCETLAFRNLELLKKLHGWSENESN